MAEKPNKAPRRAFFPFKRPLVAQKAVGEKGRPRNKSSLFSLALYFFKMDSRSTLG